MVDRSSADASAVGVNGQVQLNTEVSTSIAMKIASPNDTNPDCIAQSGVTYGVANRYATSNGAEGSKQVDTFDGTTGGADEINTNTSCCDSREPQNRPTRAVLPFIRHADPNITPPDYRKRSRFVKPGKYVII